MSHYAKRNPENPHGLQGGHFPQPPSKYAGLTPEEVLDRMAQDNAQNQRFVEHGPAMMPWLKFLLHERPDVISSAGTVELFTLVAKIEGRTP